MGYRSEMFESHLLIETSPFWQSDVQGSTTLTRTISKFKAPHWCCEAFVLPECAKNRNDQSNEKCDSKVTQGVILQTD